MLVPWIVAIYLLKHLLISDLALALLLASQILIQMTAILNLEEVFMIYSLDVR